MSWPLRFLKGGLEGQPGRIGDAYYAPWLLTTPMQSQVLSKKYRECWASSRPPIVIIVPSLARFCVDALAIGKDGPYGDGWTVSGWIDGPCNLTVSPSIHFVGSYHGWLKDGMLSDDIDGRVYDADGFER